MIFFIPADNLFSGFISNGARYFSCSSRTIYHCQNCHFAVGGIYIKITGDTKQIPNKTNLKTCNLETLKSLFSLVDPPDSEDLLGISSENFLYIVLLKIPSSSKFHLIFFLFLLSKKYNIKNPED